MNYRKKNLGKRLETMIESANISYFFRDMAWIEKQEVQKKYVNGRLAYTKKGAPDFMGVVAGGRAIGFDCKSTKGKNLPLKNIMDRPHQLQQLTKMHKLGGIAFYLVGFEDLDRYFVLTIPELERFLATEARKSIPIDYFKKEVKESRESCLDFLEPFHIKGGQSYVYETNIL